MGDNAAPKGGGVSVLDGWLGGPWARDAFSLILSRVGQSWAVLLSHTEKLSLTASVPLSLPWEIEHAVTSAATFSVLCASSWDR